MISPHRMLSPEAANGCDQHCEGKNDLEREWLGQVIVVGIHHAGRRGVANDTPRAFASLLTPSIRHFGMEPDCFQLETVVGATFNARATDTVPPSKSIISAAVCITKHYDNRNDSARG